MKFYLPVEEIEELDGEDMEAVNTAMHDALVDLQRRYERKKPPGYRVEVGAIAADLRTYENLEGETAKYEFMLGVMQGHCPPYCIFTVTDGGIGVRVDVEDAKEGVDLLVSDSSDIKFSLEPQEVLIVNDHGNATFGVANRGEFKEIWSIV